VTTRGWARSRMAPLMLLLTTIGCARPWTVMHQTVPNPLRQHISFVVEPMRFDGVVVGASTEEEFLLGADAQQVAAWQALKDDINAKFFQSVAEHAAGVNIAAAATSTDTYFIRTVCRYINPGHWGGGTFHEAELRVGVQIVTPDGQVIDEIGTGSQVGVSSIDWLGGFDRMARRLRKAGSRLGAVVARYLHERTQLRS